MIDYKGLIDGLQPEKIKQLLYHLGADTVIEKQNHFITNTICHNSYEGSLKLYYYFDTHLFVCYTECGAMNIFKFLQTYYENRQIDFNWYKDVLQVVEACSTNSANGIEVDLDSYQSIADNYKHGNVKKLQIFDETVLEMFTKTYPAEWLKDNITKAAMDKFNILYWINQNKIIIPHYDVLNRLVGIRGRALNEWEIENVGKYAPIQVENRWYSHPLSLNLYGLNETKNSIKRNGICYICESEKSVLQLEGFSLPNCGVAVCGSSLNRFQLQLLLKEANPQEICICFDNEEKEKEDRYFYKLYNMCKKYKDYANFSFIYDRNGLTKLKDSPTDCGEEIFKILLNERIKVR